MAVPKKKTSRSKRDMRRSHHALPTPNLTPCPHCDELTPSHQVCPKCGQYDGKQILEIAD